MIWKIAAASEYLAITGWGITDIRLAKKSWVFPGQRYTRLDMSPVNYTFEVQGMSAEKLPFVLPAVFTIGPRVDDMDSLLLYATLMSNHDKRSKHVEELVQGVIEGETRVLAASMTMEQIFKGTKEFKKEVFEKVQLELNQFGLLIYNANVKQLVDVPGHEYFSYLGQKTQMEAANQAKIDVAEAKKKGEIGAKERQGLTSQNAAKIDAETKIITTQRLGDAQKEEINVKTSVELYRNQKEAELVKSKAELATKNAGWSQASQLAEVEAAKAVAIREAELQTEVEKKKALNQTEKLRAELLSKAAVEYETKIDIFYIVFALTVSDAICPWKTYEKLNILRNVWAERKVVLDELDSKIRRNFECRDWLPLMDIGHPPPASLIREFYSNLSVHSNDSNTQFVKSWIRGEEYIITPSVVASALGVPKVQHHVYPYDESFPLNDIISYLTGSFI
ncbi:flotillin-like protein 3 [Quercus suber]|uniref:flotillin-like protein 3 n=1 Tax=Quercus suber TaxID=58331 RepID=UPI0032E01345